jgi:hypothetical protein
MAGVGGRYWGRRIFAGFVVLTGVSLVLGYWGLLLRARASPDFRTHWWDLVYWDLQLFVLDSEPAMDGHHMPVALHIARFTAPAVTVYALVRTAYVLFERRLSQVAIQLYRGHVVVCGLEPAAAVLVRELVEAGERVVVVADRVVLPTELPPGARLVVGDARAEDVLRRAGIGQARDVMAVSSDSSFNAEVGLVVRALAEREDRDLTCHAEIADRQVCAALVAGGDRPGLHFFSRHDRAASDLVEQSALGSSHPDRAGDAAVLVVGSGQLAQAVLLEIGRLWALLVPVWREKGLAVTALPVRVADPDGDLTAELHRLPLPEGALQLTIEHVDPRLLTTAERLRMPATTPAASLAMTSAATPATTSAAGPAEPAAMDDPVDPAHVFVCLDDDLLALRFGIVATDALPRAQVLAAVTSGTVFGEVLGRVDGEAAVPGTRGRLVLHNVTRTVYASRSVRRDQIEDMARAAHRVYVAAAMARGETPESNPSMVTWEELPEDLRAANRAQAEDVPRKLEAIGCEIGPTAEDFTFTDDEVEMLARLEHDRWMAERRSQGWTYASPRDNARKHHDKLVPWDELGDADREKDRTAVRTIPGFFSGGLGIVRRPAP